MIALLQMPEAMTQRLAGVLVHFVWQGTAIVAALALMTYLCRITRPTQRYAASLIAFLLMATCPICTYFWIEPRNELVTTPAITSAELGPRNSVSDVSRQSVDTRAGSPAVITLIATDHDLKVDQAESDPFSTTESARSDSPPRLGSDRSSIVQSIRPAGPSIWQQLQPLIVALWFIGVSFLSLRLLLGWIGVSRLRGHSESVPDWVVQRVQKLSTSLRVAMPAVRLSQRVTEAVALGFLKPLILLPVAWVTELPPDMLDAVIAHELAHIRRGDLWINLLQRVFETLLFYHPAVWWLSRRIRVERELCCDARVVEVTRNPIRYAETLEHVGRLNLARSQSLLVVSIAGNRSALVERIRHILNLEPRDRTFNVWLAGVLPIAITTAIWWSGMGLPPASVKANDQLTAVASPQEKPADTNAPAEVDTAKPVAYPDLELVQRELNGVPFQHDHSIDSIGWLDGGDSLLTTSRAGLQVWDVATRKIKWQMSIPESNDCFATVTADGTRIAMVDQRGFKLIEWPSGKVLRTGVGSVGSAEYRRNGGIQSLVLSPDGKKVAIAYIQTGNHGYLRIFDTDSGKMLADRVGPPTPALCWSPDSQLLAAGEKRGIVVFLKPDGTLLRPGIKLAVVEQPLSLTFNRDGSRLAVLTSNGSTSIWKMTDRKPVWVWQAPEDSRLSDVRDGYSGIVFNQDETRLMTRSYRAAKIFKADTGEIVGDARADFAYGGLAASPQTNLIAVGTSRNGVDLLDGLTLKSTLPTEDVQIPSIREIRLSPNRQHLLTVGAEHIEVLDALTFQKLGRLEFGTWISEACWSPTGENIVVAHHGKSDSNAAIEVISCGPAMMQSTGKPLEVIRALSLETDYVEAIAYTNDPQLVVVADRRHAALWNVSTGSQVWRKQVCGEPDWLDRVAVSPDGTGIAVSELRGGTEGEIHCLRSTDGEELGVLPMYDRPLRMLFTDPTTLVTTVDYRSTSPFTVAGEKIPILREWDFVTRKEHTDRLVTTTVDSPLAANLAYDSQSNRLLFAQPIRTILTWELSLRDAKTRDELHRFQLPGPINDTTFLPENRIAFVKENGNVIILRDPAPPRKGPPASDAKAAADTKPPASSADKLNQLIAQVREQEDRLRNYTATIKVTREYTPPKEERRTSGISFGPFPVRSITETNQQTVRGNRFKFTNEDVQLMTSGEQTVSRRSWVFDGENTTTIEEGNSATVFAGPVESPRMVPPHSWGMYFGPVNFPLSTYLSGTEAISREPKAGQFPIGRGTVHEIYKARAEVIDDETFNDLKCIKVRTKRWYRENFDPIIQDLWLAKDRNLHVARTVESYMQKGAEIIGKSARVTKWQQLADGVWLPIAVQVDPPSPDAKTTGLRIAERLTVENAVLNPPLPDGYFTRPEIPAALPKFGFDGNRRLIDSPQHPVAAQAAPNTTLNSILNQLDEEEQKYNNYKVVTRQIYTHLAKDLDGGGINVSQDSKETSFAGKTRAFYTKHQAVKQASGETMSLFQDESYDGKLTRFRYKNESTSRSDIGATLRVGPNDDLSVVRPHTMLFRQAHKHQSLARYLRSGWEDFINKYPLTVEHVGDEKIGELHCHKLKAITVANHYYFVWLARDRNLIPIRHEWHDPGWSTTLPTGLKYVSEWREIQPGIWFPNHTTELAFQKISRDGLAFRQIALQWRSDIAVESFELDVKPEDSQLEIEVPEGTIVMVKNEQGERLGTFKQAQAGVLGLSPEGLLDLRQKAKVSKEQEALRQAAHAALIGKPAPELPRETWLNSSPLSWKDLAGKVVIVDFWATWCGPCEPDLQRLADLHQHYQDNGITDRVILGIHTAGSEREKIVKAAQDKKLNYPIVIDSVKGGKHSWGDLCEQFAIQQLPLTVVIDREGKIAAFGRLEEMLSKAAQLAKP